MWTVWIVSTVIDSTEPKYTRYAEVEHFETCEHVARDLEAEFTQDEYVVCEGTEQWKHDPGAYDLQTEFFVHYQDETHVGNHEMNFYGDEDKYFVDKQEALDYIKILEAQAKELDKT
jgi:hypothetical protein